MKRVLGGAKTNWQEFCAVLECGAMRKWQEFLEKCKVLWVVHKEMAGVLGGGTGRGKSKWQGFWVVQMEGKLGGAGRCKGPLARCYKQMVGAAP